ncbi:hypothetical protein GCM10027456_40360 [Kineosporia babensis]
MHLYRHTTLTSGQIRDLVGASVNSTRRRLGILRRQGWIDSFWTRRSGLLLPQHWVLAEAGHRWAAFHEHEQPLTARQLRVRTEAVAAGTQLAHTDGIHDFFVGLVRAARILSSPDNEPLDLPSHAGAPASPGRRTLLAPQDPTEAEAEPLRAHPPGRYRLARWWSSAHVGNRLNMMVRPDGHGVWEFQAVEAVPSPDAPSCSDEPVEVCADQNGTRLPAPETTAAEGSETEGATSPAVPRAHQVGFYLEYDRGTETLERLVAKIGPYQRMRTERFGPDWVLLFVLPTLRRESNVHRALHGLTVFGGPATPAPSIPRGDLPVFTTNQHEIDAQQLLGPAAAVWWPLTPPQEPPGSFSPPHPRLRLAQLPAGRDLHWYLDPGAPTPADDPLRPLREQAHRMGSPPRP